MVNHQPQSCSLTLQTQSPFLLPYFFKANYEILLFLMAPARSDMHNFSQSTHFSGLSLAELESGSMIEFPDNIMQLVHYQRVSRGRLNWRPRWTWGEVKKSVVKGDLWSHQPSKLTAVSHWMQHENRTNLQDIQMLSWWIKSFHIEDD